MYSVLVYYLYTIAIIGSWGVESPLNILLATKQLNNIINIVLLDYIKLFSEFH